jgi:hypothetical protein
MSAPLFPATAESHALTVIRRFVLVLFILGSIITGGELLLVDHTEGFWQWLPLALFVLSFIVLAWHAIAPSAASVRVFQATMVLFVLSGLVGLFLHYDGKVEFRLESNPSLAGWALFKEAMAGAVPPALAPAAMIHFGLLGLAYAYRHPALPRRQKISNIPLDK